MRSKFRWILPAMTVLLGVDLFVSVNDGAQPSPRSPTIGSNPPGTFSDDVQPYTGTSTFLPLLNTGEIDFGINNSVDMALAYQGPERLKIGGRNPFQHTPNTNAW